MAIRNLLTNRIIPTLALLGMLACTQRKIDFNTEIRPILNEHCVSCHGGVKRSGGFGLVFRENALGETENGKIGIVPGAPDESEMYRRIIHHDPEERMPQEREPLNPEDIALIKKWITQGAEWKQHWAYIAPRQQSPPALSSGWVQNDVDRFILAKIQLHGLTPSAPADQQTLVRRLFLDLTGLPPNQEQVQAFLQDRSVDAYEKLVDSLLDSPHFGEHWASLWLDLARYADSFGYSADIDRVIWKYRDWVIRALNEDMPFDQFTIEQLAGDLLPDPSLDQLTATAFHRNSLTNGEGGADHEEFRNASVIDRVATTWEIWQATTIGCVQCHHHPYDPIKQVDFYRSFAFFNNTNDRNLRHDFPLLKTLGEKDEQQLEKIKDWITQYGSQQQANQVERMVRTHEPKIVPTDFAETTNTQYYNRTGDDFMVVYDSSSIKIESVDLREIDHLYLNYQQPAKNQGRIVIRLNNLDGPVIGKAVLKQTKGLEVLPIPIKTDAHLQDLYITFSSHQADYTCQVDGFVLGQKMPDADTPGRQEIQQIVDQLMNEPAQATTPIMVEKKEAYRRKTHVFERGNWLVPGQEVKAGIPPVLNPENKKYENRLDLAEWLVSKDNPLTARVTVNRIWARLFGKGIVQTLEDFGVMGDRPSHPELLDWLALNFSEDQGWHLKKLIKLLVMSATYRQSSRIDPNAREKDPDNVWLARSPRVRLSAEQVRDQALQVSGLLSKKMYGPGVMPVQPEGIWKVSFSNAKWETSKGEDRYRRAIYTYIKRSALYPSFLTFDAAGREVCLSRRITTNTPLQALVTLNDPVYVEAAQALAQQIMAIEGDVAHRLSEAYTLVMGKRPTQERVGVLQRLYLETKQYYEANKEEAFVLAQPESIEQAVFTVVANSLMNMDEFIVRG